MRSVQLSSNDAMLDVAAKLKDKGIKMFASWQDIIIGTEFRALQVTPFITDRA